MQKVQSQQWFLIAMTTTVRTISDGSVRPYTVYVLATQDASTLECSRRGERKKCMRSHVQRISQEKYFKFKEIVIFLKGLQRNEEGYVLFNSCI